MDITKCLTISTSHISAATGRKLKEEPVTNHMGLSVYDKAGYGYWIYCGERGQFSNKNIPEDLWRCMNVAYDNHCEWLCLDEDGEELENLYNYDR